MLVKFENFPKDRDEHKKHLKPSPRSYFTLYPKSIFCTLNLNWWINYITIITFELHLYIMLVPPTETIFETNGRRLLGKKKFPIEMLWRLLSQWSSQHWPPPQECFGAKFFEGQRVIDLSPFGGGFLKWWYPKTIGFPTKNDHFGVFFGGYHHLRKHPGGSNCS